MPILVTFKLLGDPDELLRQKQEKIDPTREKVGREHGGLDHLVAKTDEGLLVIDLFESQEGMQAVFGAISAKAQELDFPVAPSDFQAHELVQRDTA
jgi:hypothetical protein